MEFEYTVDEIKEFIADSKIEGHTDVSISGVGSLEEAIPGDLTFLGNSKYRKLVSSTKASLVLVPKDFQGKPNDNQVFLRVADPSLALSILCQNVEKLLWPTPEPGIHSSAVIESDVTIDPSASVGPLAVVQSGSTIGANTIIDSSVHIGRNCSVGENSWIMPKVSVLDYCKVGSRVRLHSGVVLGSDGFGYDTVAGNHQKTPQLGNVVIEDDVEIGANTTIDRARFNETRIGRGTKIDNLVQIGHNVIVGKHCIIVAQTGIAGSTTLEDYVVLGGQVGIVGHVRIGAGTQIGSQSGINNNVEPGSALRGSPAYPIMQAHRIDILKRRLPELFERVKTMEQLLETQEVKS